MQTAFFFHKQFLEHDTGLFHPENHERLNAIVRGLKESGLWTQLQHVEPRRATEEEILLCHSKRHFDFIRAITMKKSYQIDPDTHVSTESWDAALFAAGAAVQAVDEIMDDRYRNAFAAVRPPGHHATPDRAMGFCLFNNIAIAARHAIRNHGLERVAIVDWDVHHGNGTQDIFYDDPAVLYISLHKRDHYPGTGWEDETGEGAAKGTNLNFPLPGVPGPERYLKAFHLALEVAADFRPEFIFISCGFDAHERDPLGNLGLTDEVYAKMTDALMNLAQQCGHQRIFSILEGGYDYNALASAPAAHVERLLNHHA